MNRLFLLLFFLATSVISFANDELVFKGVKVELEVGYIDPEDIPMPRTPIVTPLVYIDGTTLYFCNSSCSTLQIVNEDGGVCFETIISEGTERITLPSYLGGDYEIRIIDRNCVYYGDITL
ncbi:MAG: hypothetical protein IJ421_04390 [Prevotella sp.]|nr:hypothetical protein [Prevotella sp.]